MHLHVSQGFRQLPVLTRREVPAYRARAPTRVATVGVAVECMPETIGTSAASICPFLPAREGGVACVEAKHELCGGTDHIPLS